MYCLQTLTYDSDQHIIIPLNVKTKRHMLLECNSTWKKLEDQCLCHNNMCQSVRCSVWSPHWSAFAVCNTCTHQTLSLFYLSFVNIRCHSLCIVFTLMWRFVQVRSQISSWIVYVKPHFPKLNDGILLIIYIFFNSPTNHLLSKTYVCCFHGFILE